MNIKDLYLKNGVYHNKYTDNLFTGSINDGNEIGRIENGLKDGVWKEIREQDEQVIEGYFDMGMPDKIWTVWTKGKISLQRFYENGKKTSVKIYDENLNLKRLTIYESEEEQTSYCYNELGEKVSVEYIKNEQLEKEKVFSDFGEKLQKIIYYKDNEISFTEIYNNGKLIKKINE